MPFVAAVAFITKFHLLLNNIMRKVMKGVWEARERIKLRSDFHNYTTVNTLKQLGSPHKLNREKETWAEDQKLKINVEWPHINKASNI